MPHIAVGFTYFLGVAPPPPIPAPSGSLTFDDFESYTLDSLLAGLNSGSNEWDNTTPLAAYFAPATYIDIQATDDFENYTVDTIITGSNSIQSGSGLWNDEYPYQGHDSVWGYFYDSFSEYETGSALNGSGSYLNTSTRRKWAGDWVARRLETGITSFDDFSLYTTGSLLSGSGYTPRPDWPWNGNWDTKNMT